MGWKGLAAGTAVPFTRGLCHRARPRVAPGAERHASTRVREGTQGSQHLARRPWPPCTQACLAGLPEPRRSRRLCLGLAAHLAEAKGPGWAGPGCSRTVPAGAPALPRRWGRRHRWLCLAQQSPFLCLSLACSLHPLPSERFRGTLGGTRHTGDTSHRLSHTRRPLSCPSPTRPLGIHLGRGTPQLPACLGLNSSWME